MPRSPPFFPHPNRESYKDLLIFEERLKQNAERLQKQRRKYEAFLLSLIGIILYLSYTVFILPSIYSLVHYGNVALLLVSLVTLALFFATGMYSDKITYAYKFVPQANRALRPFNIYLNTRTRTRFPFLASLLRLSPLPSAPAPSTSQTPPSSAPLSRRTSSSSSHSSSSARSLRGNRSPPGSPVSRSPGTSPPPPAGPVARGVPLAPIPPAQNPRGELIFSSRVSATFREGYERYRGEWEKRRNEGLRSGEGRGAKLARWLRGGGRGSPSPSGSEKEREREGSAESEAWGKRERGRTLSATDKPRPRERGEGRPHRNSTSSIASSRSSSISPPVTRPSSPEGHGRSLRPAEVRVRAESFSTLLSTMNEDGGTGDG